MLPGLPSYQVWLLQVLYNQRKDIKNLSLELILVMSSYLQGKICEGRPTILPNVVAIGLIVVNIKP